MKRMKRFLSDYLGVLIFLLVTSVFVIIVSGNLFMEYYLKWIARGLFWFMLGIIVVCYGIFGKFNVAGTIARGFVRVVVGLMGGGLILIFFIETFGGLLDFGSYLRKDYGRVEGVPVKISEMTRRSAWHTIEVDGIRLLNTQKDIDKYLNQETEFYYLPRSKFVVKIKAKE